MKIVVEIFNNTTGDRIYNICEGSIDGAIAHLGTAQRHLKKCKGCGEPMNTLEDSFCTETCRDLLMLAKTNETPF